MSLKHVAVTALGTIVVMAIVFRVKALKDIVVGA